jgi:O-antigen/teichoic acid export membrane protein
LLLSNAIGKVISDKISLIRDTGLMARSTRGSIILGVGTVVERLLRLVRNMILARLLAPEDFGLMAIIFAVSMAFECFSDIGVRQSIIQNKRGDSLGYLNVAWWFQGVRGLCLFVIAFLAVPWVSRFYGKPELLPLMRFAFVAILFNGFVSPRVAVLEKKFQFSKWVFFRQGSGLVGTLITLGLAFFFVRNVWALVIGFVAEAVFRFLLSFILCPFVPTTSIDRDMLRDLLKYARGMLGLAFLTIVAFQTDIMVLSKVVSTEQVGMYALAFALAHQPAVMFGQTIGRILLSAFAEKQDDKQILRRSTLTILRTTVMFGVPLVALAAIFAGPIVSVVYGRKYVAVAVPFAILCFATLFKIQGVIFSQIYMAIGKPHLHRRFATLLAVLIIGLIYPSIALFGLAGAAGAILLSNAIAVCAQVVWMRGSIGLAFKDYICCWFQSPKLLGKLVGR